MKVLVACEESQAVTKELRRLGHEAYSCDIIECSGGHPEWHIRCDVLELINGNCGFMTMDGELHRVDGKWDMILAFHHVHTWLLAAQDILKSSDQTEDKEKALNSFVSS